MVTEKFLFLKLLPTKGFATSWEKVYFVPVSCFLCFTVGNFLGRLVGFSISLAVKASNSGDAPPSNAHPNAGPLAHPAPGARPPPLPRLQPGAPQALLHPRPHPLRRCLHLPHAHLQYLYWNSHQVFAKQRLLVSVMNFLFQCSDGGGED